MTKFIIKLVILAAIANGTWRIGSAYLRYYRFVDSVTQAAQFGGTRSDAQLQARVLELARNLDIPLEEDGFTVRRDRDHTIVEGAYTDPLEVLPRYTYPWTFRWTVDTFVVTPARIDPTASQSP